MPVPVYLDHAATSPMPEPVRIAYLDALQTAGNPSSLHSAGQSARALWEEARTRIAATVGVDAVELTFTGGGTEAVNLAVKGLFWQSRSRSSARTRLLVPRAEHHATLDAVEWLVEHEGARVTWLDVDAEGVLLVESVAAALADVGADASRGADDVALITMLAANNEVGSVQPVAEVAALAAAHGVPLHVDAIAAYGQYDLSPLPVGVSALSISAHTVGGPVGVGALALRRGTEVVPLLHGGTQQRGRSGTMDAPGAWAFAVAAEAAHAELAERGAHKAALRDRLEAGIRDRVPQAVLHGTGAASRLPGTVHLTVPGCEGDSLLFLVDQAGFAVSTGSACQSGVPEPSHVLLAMGLSAADARGALRVTIGPATTVDEIDALLDVLPAAVARAEAAGLAARAPTMGR